MVSKDDIEPGLIINARIYIDSIINDNFCEIAKDLEGEEFKKVNIINSIIIKENLIE